MQLEPLSAVIDWSKREQTLKTPWKMSSSSTEEGWTKTCLEGNTVCGQSLCVGCNWQVIAILAQLFLGKFTHCFVARSSKSKVKHWVFGETDLKDHWPGNMQKVNTEMVTCPFFCFSVFTYLCLQPLSFTISIFFSLSLSFSLSFFHRKTNNDELAYRTQLSGVYWRHLRERSL